MRPVLVKFMLAAEEMPRALAFWRAAFGFEATIDDGEHWAELDACGSILALHGGHDGSRNPTGFSVEVDDITEAVAAVTRAGGAPEWGPRPPDHPGSPWLATVRDTEGNTFMLSMPG